METSNECKLPCELHEELQMKVHTGYMKHHTEFQSLHESQIQVCMHLCSHNSNEIVPKSLCLEVTLMFAGQTASSFQVTLLSASHKVLKDVKTHQNHHTYGPPIPTFKLASHSIHDIALRERESKAIARPAHHTFTSL